MLCNMTKLKSWHVIHVWLTSTLLSQLLIHMAARGGQAPLSSAVAAENAVLATDMADTLRAHSGILTN